MITPQALVLPMITQQALVLPTPENRVAQLLGDQAGDCGPCSARNAYNRTVFQTNNPCDSVNRQEYTSGRQGGNYQPSTGPDYVNRFSRQVPSNSVLNLFGQYDRGVPGNPSTPIVSQWDRTYYQPGRTIPPESNNNRICRRWEYKPPQQTIVRRPIHPRSQNGRPCDCVSHIGFDQNQGSRDVVNQSLSSNQFTQYVSLRQPPRIGIQDRPQQSIFSRRRSVTTPEDRDCFDTSAPYMPQAATLPGQGAFFPQIGAMARSVPAGGLYE